MAILAYIDAGSGSLVIQAVIAALVAAPFVLRHHIGRAVQRLRRDVTAPTDLRRDPDQLR